MASRAVLAWGLDPFFRGEIWAPTFCHPCLAD